MISPLFSIIVPLFNKIDYLDKNLRSILSQSFHCFEVIVVDDGSTDGSSAIIEKVSTQDPRIVYKRFENGGVSVARNRGLDMAQGEYVLFIDADDWIETNYLEQIHDAISRESADIYIWGLTKDYSDKSVIQTPIMSGACSRRDFMGNMVIEQYGENEGLYGYICNKAIRRDLIINNGIRFNPQIKLQEDYDFFLNCYRCADSFYCFNACGYHYIIDVNPQCQRKSGNVNYIQLYGIANKCLEIVKENGIAASQKNVLENTCANLLLSGFLEMNPVCDEKIIELYAFLSQNQNAANIFSQLKTKYRILKVLILSRNSILTKFYLILWRQYLSLKQHIDS